MRTIQLQDRLKNMLENRKLTRPNSEYLNNILGEEFKVLDHGFIRVVDYMGDDSAVVQAARVSYGKGTKQRSEDRGLIRYLIKHSHTSPLEMCELKLHLKMPVFVARQWIRHRMASLNEYSARYSEIKDEFYVPEVSRVQLQSLVNKQGSGETATEKAADFFIEKTKNIQSYVLNVYNFFNEFVLGKDGHPLDLPLSSEHPQSYQIAKELNRINVTVANYTELYWKIDLHNLLHFLSLRCDSHAQYEIRVFADQIYEIVKQWCPLVVEAFDDYNSRRNAKTLSRMELELVKLVFKKESDIITDEDIREELVRLGSSKREADEFIKIIRS